MTDDGRAQLEECLKSIAEPDVSAISFGFMSRSRGMIDTIPMELGILYAAIFEILPTAPERRAKEADLFSSADYLRKECAALLAEMDPEQRRLVFAKARSLARGE